MSSMHPPSLSFSPDLVGASPVRAALVWAFGIAEPVPDSSPGPYLAALLERVRAAGPGFIPPERRAAVRDLLRHGAYKPSGRAKPSSEYLLAAALADVFPIVNAPVDANNAASLEYGYPASVFDLDLTGPELLLRRGTPGSSYVFNASGQTIDLTDLLCVWRRSGNDGWEPCGNPVKDSMATKVNLLCRSVAAVVYAPAAEDLRDLHACARTLEGLFRAECGAAETGLMVAEA
jgi:DNA/RNA-binding domain of Phe-tRNA-synthetase-like protein